jgi:membrane protein DedA with SNARE-associated domain
LEIALEADGRKPLSPAKRRVVRTCVGLMAALVAVSTVGTAASFYLMGVAPLLLVAMSPVGRHVFLAAPVVDPFALAAVLIVRRQLFYGCSFFLGRALGPDIIPWIEQRVAFAGRFIRLMERLFGRAPRLVVATMAGPTVSTLAGISGMAIKTYMLLVFLSLTVRATLMVGFAELTETYLQMGRVWVDEYRVPGTILMVLGVAIYLRRNGLQAFLPPGVGSTQKS